MGLAYLYILFRRRSFSLVLGTAILAFLLLSLDFFSRIIAVRTMETSLRDPSLLGRLVLWSYAWKVGRENWLLGVGWHNFGYVKYFYGFPGAPADGIRYHAHNAFLEFFTGLGVPGLVAFVWLSTRSILGLDRLARSGSGRSAGDMSVTALSLNAGIVAFLSHNLVDTTVWHYGTFLFLGVLLGLALSAERLSPVRPIGLGSQC